MRDTGPHIVQAERLEVICHFGCGSKLTVAEFGILVNITTPLDDFGLDAGERVVEIVRGILSMGCEGQDKAYKCE